MAQFKMSHQILEAHQIKKPPLLYDLCVRLIVSYIDDIYNSWTDQYQPGPLDKLAGTIVQDILETAYQLSHKQWRRTWKVLLTPKLKSAILTWDENLLKFTTRKCQIALHLTPEGPGLSPRDGPETAPIPLRASPRYCPGNCGRDLPHPGLCAGAAVITSLSAGIGTLYEAC
ncbi:hypothetical protein M8J76_014873 [Diaphorina citri]|nr:hypothetical protein M8J76_014873 [Diaphorina citri]